MAPGNYAQLCVGDTGVGMTEEVRAHVFEPFFTTKEAGKGTGLGLATCFGIVKQSQGFIDFDTEPGRGTTFRIAFPGIKAEDAARIKREALPGLPRGHETILLVEDEPHLRRLVARVLRAQGYTIWEASDGREAMSLVMERGTGFHLLLSDVVMPELSGKTLADQLRSICPEARVLFVSGYISNTVVQEALASSSVAFLQKPFTPSDLVRKVRDVLDAPQRSRKTGSLR
jgi:CheY-like chemotaxis protein